MTYSTKLKDPRWQRKRLEVFQRDGFTCKKCGFTDNTLCVHHIKYNGEPWDAPMSNLDTLCEQCHSVVERRKKEPDFIYNDMKISKFIKDYNMAYYCMIYSYADKMVIETIDAKFNVIYTISVCSNHVKKAIKEHLRYG